MTQKSPETEILHQKTITLKEGNFPLVQPIYQTAKFSFDSLEQAKEVISGKKSGFFYSRISNPTLRHLENSLALLQNRSKCILTSSGMSALSTTLFSLLNQNDHIISFIESYQPCRHLIRTIMAKFGIQSTFLSVDRLDLLEDAIIKGKTKAILFESPTNPQLKICDIEKIIDIAKKNKITTILDNTFAGFHNHGQYEIDIFVHSLTKFAGGHSDVMGGAIIGNGSKIQKISKNSICLGGILDPHACYLIQRGLQTYFLRYEKQCQNATLVATFLESHPSIKTVRYPGLESDPSNALAKKQMKDFGTVIMIDVDPEKFSSVDAIINKLEIFILSASLGSVKSLIAPVLYFYGSGLSNQEKKAANLTEHSLRLSIGIENSKDLIDDLAKALDN